MSEEQMVPRPAATLALVRDGQAGVEVFMVRRTQRAAFHPGAYVFPGGALDPADQTRDLEHLVHGLDAAAASKQLGVELGGLAYHVAAIRECFEESGWLLAYDSQGNYVNLNHPARKQPFSEFRARLAAGEGSLIELCRSYDIRLAVDRLAYLSHWVTPPGRPRRFDTRFFVAVAPESQTPSHDGDEVIHHMWIRPQDALERQQAGTLTLPRPTIATLDALAPLPDTQAVMDFVHRQGG